MSISYATRLAATPIHWKGPRSDLATARRICFWKRVVCPFLLPFCRSDNTIPWCTPGAYLLPLLLFTHRLYSLIPIHRICRYLFRNTLDCQENIQGNIKFLMPERRPMNLPTLHRRPEISSN